MTFSGPVGDLIEFSIGGGWGLIEQKTGHSEVAVIRGTDIPKVAMGDISTVPRRFESDKKLTNRLLKVGDVVLETAGGSSANGQFTGRTLLITDEILSSLGPTICASFCKRLALNTDVVEPGFFYWHMQDLYSSGRVAIYDSQSTGISNFQFSSFLDSEIIELPDLPTQKLIANSLSNLNALIRLNLKVAQSLEDMAQTIFKSWFIDFDPVKAKMVGEKPVGMDDSIAALFPDSMEDSELGPIPTGWSVEDFGDVNHLLMGQSPPGDTYNTVGEGVPFYQGRTDFGMRFPKQRVFCTAGTRFAKTGEVLISVRAPVGDLNQAIEDCVIGRGVASALHKSASQVYSYALLSSLKPKLAYYNGEGSVFGAINRSDFNSLKVVEPLRKVIDLFDTVTSAFNDEIRNLFVKTESLTQMRDSLLPRLISGELQIPKEMLAS
jgi:type I restriction enzyme S subunit